jgi:alpha-mannosidase
MTRPTSLIVCPTSHMDWDWSSSFEEYYKTSNFSTNIGPVQRILDSAVALFNNEPTFFFSVAEIAWIQRYLVDQGGTLPSAPNLTETLRLMGGAITSPDNLTCDGEVFVRAYLLGRQWAQSVGLGAALENISWMPDDYGHDPELPVILTAMGLTAVGFARVPGAFPNFNPPLKGGASLARQLMGQGVAFNWQAGDSSSVFANFMPETYGVPFASSDSALNSLAWRTFIRSEFLTPSSQGYARSDLREVVWPGGIAFAPAGGDFSVPDSDWVGGVNQFNGENYGTTAKVGTFAEYVAAVLASGATLNTIKIDPSNFWTGYFGSRPALKILQARASRELVAAESASSFLRLGSNTSGAALDALDSAIAQGWSILAPSSHHDFVTGTAPDRVYKMEQLPMASLAARAARAAYTQAVQIIADSIEPSDSGAVVAVYNPVGVARGGVFELERGTAVSLGTPPSPAIVQPLAGGGLLVESLVTPSLGYTSGLVTFGKPATPPAPVSLVEDGTIDNGVIAITLSRNQQWAITSIVPSGGSNVLPDGSAANLLQIYTDSGNLYQYGNEPGAGGSFDVQKGALAGAKAAQTEFGPLRWRVEAEVTARQGGKYLIVYTLVTGESLVRIRVTGSAPANSTVVTTFPAVATDGTTMGTHLVYGTAHHFHDDEAPAYWRGPMFKATHDFLMPADDSSGATFALAAIYHSGMPAWACDRSQGKAMLLGSLFRNTDGMQRGAAGTDSDTHTQRYALRISSTALDPAQGTPLVEALTATNPLRAAIGSAANRPESPITLPATGSLASAPSPALIRVTRPMGGVKSAAGKNPQGQIALRLYRPDADGSPNSIQVTMPVLTSESNATAALVTALEQPIADAPSITVNGNVLTVPTSLALTTVAVTATRPTTAPTNGRD